MELNDKIKELVQQSLPGVHAAALKDFIEDAEQLKKSYEVRLKECKTLKEQVELLKITVQEREAKLEKANEILAIEAALIKDKAEHEKKKYEFEIDKKLEAFKVEAAQQRANDAVTTMTLLVKNSVLTEDFFNSKYNPGGYTQNKDGTQTYHYSGDVKEEQKYRKEATKEL